jgi:hypothetical protein
MVGAGGCRRTWSIEVFDTTSAWIEVSDGIEATDYFEEDGEGAQRRGRWGEIVRGRVPQRSSKEKKSQC